MVKPIVMGKRISQVGDIRVGRVGVARAETSLAAVNLYMLDRITLSEARTF